MRSIKPRDELEAMLATQMGAIHIATMMMARRLNHVQSLPQQDAAERALNKLARTFTTQMDALKRYRTGGQQKVTVEHVTVNAGGQAIVGAVTRGGGRGDNGKQRQPHAPRPAPCRCATMHRNVKDHRMPLQRPRREWLERVPGA